MERYDEARMAAILRHWNSCSIILAWGICGVFSVICSVLTNLTVVVGARSGKESISI